MGKVRHEKQKEWVAKYRAKPGIREREKAYGVTYGRELYATVKGRAYNLFKSARYSAKQRGLAFDLDLPFITAQLERGYCPVLGLPFDLKSSGKGKHFSPLSPSLDRTDSSKGYTKDNVQVVSFWWNAAKNQWSVEFNVMAMRRALEHFDKRKYPWE